MLKEPNLWPQTARWHFLRGLWECVGVCVYVWIHPPPLTPENTPPSKCSWFLFFSLWDKPRRSLQASSLLVFLAAALRKVAFPILVAISRAPGAQLPLPFRRRRRGWFIVLILTSRLPRRNEGEGQDVEHKSRAAFPRRHHSCFWCFNYAPPLPPKHTIIFLLCALNCRCRLSWVFPPPNQLYLCKSKIANLIEGSPCQLRPTPKKSK